MKNKIIKFLVKNIYSITKNVTILFILSLVATIIVSWLIGDYLKQDVLFWVEKIVCGLMLFSFVLVLICFVLYLLLMIKNSFHNVRCSDDVVFSCIDNCKIENSDDYKHKISMINWCYKENLDVQKIINNKEIERLYARQDYLKVRINLFDDFTTCYYSLIISVLVSFFCRFEDVSESKTTFNIFALAICFFVVVILKYAKKGQDGSYVYQVDKFELRLLEAEIMRVENDLEMGAFKGKVKAGINSLIKELERKRKFEKYIKKDIEILKKMREADFTTLQFDLVGISLRNSEEKIYLDCNENNETGLFNFGSKVFLELYCIAYKYDMLDGCEIIKTNNTERLMK